MTKPAANKPTESSNNEQVLKAKRAFLLGLADLSWKLTGAFLIPTIVGVAVGQATWGILIGLFMSFLVIVQLARNSGAEK